MTNTGKIATGFVLGTVLGTTLGLLFAPNKGTKTRAMIAEKAKGIGQSVSHNYTKAKDLIGMNKTKEKEALIG